MSDKPTAGALRAALAIDGLTWPDARDLSNPAIIRGALTIDDTSGLRRLLEASKAVLADFDANIAEDDPDPLIKELREAIKGVEE